jgi:hypothetical protein
MVSPVRIRVPPLKKVLQIAEKERPLAVPLGPFVRGVSTAGSKKAASSSAVVAESCIYCVGVDGEGYPVMQIETEVVRPSTKTPQPAVRVALGGGLMSPFVSAPVRRS